MYSADLSVLCRVTVSRINLTLLCRLCPHNCCTYDNMAVMLLLLLMMMLMTMIMMKCITY